MKERPKIPAREVSKAENGFKNFLGLLMIPLLIIAIFIPNGFLWFIVYLAFYNLVALRTNIQDAFQLKYLKIAFAFLPINFVIALLESLSLYKIDNPIWRTVLSIQGFGTILEPTLETMPLEFFLGSIVVIGILCLVFNYLEEWYFRNRWYKVALWVGAHLILGLSIFTVCGLFWLSIMGIMFKLLYDRYGLQVSYLNHFFGNLLILSLVQIIVPILL